MPKIFFETWFYFWPATDYFEIEAKVVWADKNTLLRIKIFETLRSEIVITQADKHCYVKDNFLRNIVGSKYLLLENKGRVIFMEDHIP